MLEARSRFPTIVVGVTISFTRETASDRQYLHTAGVVGGYLQGRCVSRDAVILQYGVGSITGDSVKGVLWAIMKGFFLTLQILTVLHSTVKRFQ